MKKQLTMLILATLMACATQGCSIQQQQVAFSASVSPGLQQALWAGDPGSGTPEAGAASRASGYLTTGPASHERGYTWTSTRVERLSLQ